MSKLGKKGIIGIVVAVVVAGGAYKYYKDAPYAPYNGETIYKVRESNEYAESGDLCGLKNVKFKLGSDGVLKAISKNEASKLKKVESRKKLESVIVDSDGEVNEGLCSYAAKHSTFNIAKKDFSYSKATDDDVYNDVSKGIWSFTSSDGETSDEGKGKKLFTDYYGEAKGEKLYSAELNKLNEKNKQDALLEKKKSIADNLIKEKYAANITRSDKSEITKEINNADAEDFIESGSDLVSALRGQMPSKQEAADAVFKKKYVDLPRKDQSIIFTLLNKKTSDNIAKEIEVYK